MRNVVVGSFIGFVLAVAFLAACGGGSVVATANLPAVTGEYRWSEPGGRHTVANGLTLTGGELWRSATVFENADADARSRYAIFELAGNIADGSGGSVTVEVGLLPAPDGAHFATTPQWIGQVGLESGSNARASLYGVQIPPTRFKVALRLVGSSATVRLSLVEITPYNERLM